MPITPQWDDDARTIIVSVYEGRWTWEDLHQANAQINAMLEGITHPVDYISDMRHGNTLPRGHVMAQAQRVMSSSQASQDSLVVFVGANHFLQALWESFTRVYRQMANNYRFVDTLEDARALITTHRSRDDDTPAAP